MVHRNRLPGEVGFLAQEPFLRLMIGIMLVAVAWVIGVACGVAWTRKSSPAVVVGVAEESVPAAEITADTPVIASEGPSGESTPVSASDSNTVRPDPNLEVVIADATGTAVPEVAAQPVNEPNIADITPITRNLKYKVIDKPIFGARLGEHVDDFRRRFGITDRPDPSGNLRFDVASDDVLPESVATFVGNQLSQLLFFLKDTSRENCQVVLNNIRANHRVVFERADSGADDKYLLSVLIDNRPVTIQVVRKPAVDDQKPYLCLLYVYREILNNPRK